jgi:formylglycine-generating enzyme required for sulfatase activity
MVWVPGGTFRMGSEWDDYPEEGPPQHVAVDGFWMDASPVTVSEFRRFVQATGYVTVAERPLDPAQYPDLDPRVLRAGSQVFTLTRGPVDLGVMLNWWRYVPGARWDCPEGPASSTQGRENHPVVHVAWEDVNAYADLGRQAVADRGGMGSRGSGWPRGRDLCVG